MNEHDATEQAYRNGRKDGYKAGYQKGLEDFAARAKANASWPEWGEMHVGDIDDTLKEMLAELEGEG